MRVAPGDIVFADDTGVCFIPRERAPEVLDLARKKAAAEEAKCKAIDAGTPVADLPEERVMTAVHPPPRPESVLSAGPTRENAILVPSPLVGEG